MGRKALIEEYFQAWLTQDRSCFDRVFGEAVRYSECYGPEYCGLQQVKRWFDDWNQLGRVLAWDIKHFWQVEETCVVEWFFQCDYQGNVDGFDGVSLVRFSPENKILSLQEFQSKAEHHFPYST